MSYQLKTLIACLTIALAIHQSSMDGFAKPKSAPPFRVDKGLFDYSKPRTFGLPKIQSEHIQLFNAPENEYKFCHHPNLVVFNDRLYCMWSNGKLSEDTSGQRILYCHSDEHGRNWTKPIELANAGNGICVASGFLVLQDRLIAFYVITGGSNFHPDTAVVARTSVDGENWSKPAKVTSGFFIEAPLENPNKTLIYGGEFVGRHRASHRTRILTTQDLSGLTGWKESTIKIPDLKLFGYTEPAFFRRADGLLTVTLRNYSGYLYGSLSSDHGRSFSEPIQTNFRDSTARTSAGNLPDGTVFLVNNALPKRGDRSVLTITLSKDGELFDRAFVLRNQPTKQRFGGERKTDGWQYPNAISWKGHFYVAYSVNKEDVAVTRIDLKKLAR